jgi:hypothetical protein
MSLPLGPNAPACIHSSPEAHCDLDVQQTGIAASHTHRTQGSWVNPIVNGGNCMLY